MGCPTEVIIEEDLVFSVMVHDPANPNVLVDADAVPTYRVYEEETVTPILTGSMAKLDDGNTLGFYAELIACTVANGFEDGKTYTIYISTAVSSNAVGYSYAFKARDASTTVTGSGTINTIADGATLTTGDEGATTFANTSQRDGIYHAIDDVGGTTDLYYTFNVGGNGVPSNVTVVGRSNGNNDSILVYGYNWGTTSWDQVEP